MVVLGSFVGIPLDGLSFVARYLYEPLLISVPEGLSLESPVFEAPDPDCAVSGNS
jgi:hypothetical protein